MSWLENLPNFIPGVRTLFGAGKALGRLACLDLKGAARALTEGLGNDWLLAFVPGIGIGTQVALGVGFAADFTGVFKDGEARQPEAAHYAANQYARQMGQPPLEGPNIGW